MKVITIHPGDIPKRPHPIAERIHTLYGQEGDLWLEKVRHSDRRCHALVEDNTIHGIAILADKPDAVKICTFLCLQPGRGQEFWTEVERQEMDRGMAIIRGDVLKSESRTIAFFQRNGFHLSQHWNKPEALFLFKPLIKPENRDTGTQSQGNTATPKTTSSP